MDEALKLQIDSNGVARIVFDLPGEKVNKLTANVLKEFDRILDQLSNNSEVNILLLVSGKESIFIAGADINEIKNIQEANEGAEKSAIGQNILNKLANLSVPSIAVIDGACLGGGLELALACTYRITTDAGKTSLGLPEVNLGIIPGFGGTQRLPRLIGLQRSLSMILSGKPVDGVKAYKYKLADACVPREFLQEKLDEFMDSVQTAEGRRRIMDRRSGNSFLKFITETNPITKAVICRVVQNNIIKKTKNHYPAPLVALNVIQKTLNSDLSKGLRMEAAEFGKLAVSDISKHLVNLFFINESLKKDRGVGDSSEPLGVSSAGVLGAGIMGGGIAWLFSKAGIPVRLKDLNWDAIGKGYQAASKIYGQLKKLRKYNDREITFKMHRISGTTDYKGFKDLDVIIEAIVEDLEIKKRAFAELEQQVREDAIIASNTSTLPISEMEIGLQHPERFIGMHFFNPVNRMPLVEVIPGRHTSPKVIATIVSLTKSLGKIPIVVQSCPGFLVNRLLLPYLNEAFLMLQEGIDPQRIDRLFTRFGMPMGPFSLIDEVGLDVGYKAAQVLNKAYGTRMDVAETFSFLYKEKGLLGKKGKIGIYLYNGKKAEINADVLEVVQRHSSNGTDRTEIIDEIIIDRCLCMMINEASRCLDEKVVKNSGYLDMALILGTGFPPFKGGLLRYADKVGIPEIIDKLQRFADTFGSRFSPSEYLQDLNSNKRKFYTS